MRINRTQYARLFHKHEDQKEAALIMSLNEHILDPTHHNRESISEIKRKFFR
ncbi:hypothetical protein JOD45_000892 [Scopulibacillus daqui]|uniref:Uncharacterized protein n=1 Tax=Scopulibacillus daqui TaxID=1469162 RepID=A0ABS2PYR1_9BACL|nr:hypothetical protein [Scopulibacillus daqui]